MKLIVFGATGGTGKEIVQQALSAGHTVTVFVRDPARLTITNEALHVIQGDATDAASVEKALAGQEVVVSALGPTRPPVPGMVETAARNIVAGMRKHGLRRLIFTTGAGVRDLRDRPKLIDHVMKGLLTLMAGSVMRDSAAAVEVIRASDLDWTIVRFPRLVDGPRTGNYRVGFVGKDSGTQLSRADAADFVLRELIESKFICQMPVASD